MSEITEDSLVIVGGKRGRPKLEEPLTVVTARIPVTLYDRLAQLSIDQDKSVSSLVRHLLTLRIDRTK